jgi:hypothetical protein
LTPTISYSRRAFLVFPACFLGIILRDDEDDLSHYSDIGLHDERAVERPTAPALASQLERAQIASSRENKQLQERNEALLRTKQALEKTSVDHSHHIQTLEQEIKVLTNQLQTVLEDAQQRPKRARALGGDEAVVVQVGESASAETIGTNGFDLNQALEGLNNCVRLVTDGKVSRQGAMMYLAGVHLLLLIMLFRCLW